MPTINCPLKNMHTNHGGCGVGLVRPVQRIAGQAANGPEDSLPFVLDDDAVAPAFQQPLPGQQPGNDMGAVDPMPSNRPRYGHRSPASALAGAAQLHDYHASVLFL